MNIGKQTNQYHLLLQTVDASDYSCLSYMIGYRRVLQLGISILDTPFVALFSCAAFTFRQQNV